MSISTFLSYAFRDKTLDASWSRRYDALAKEHDFRPYGAAKSSGPTRLELRRMVLAGLEGLQSLEIQRSEFVNSSDKLVSRGYRPNPSYAQALATYTAKRQERDTLEHKLRDLYGNAGVIMIKFGEEANGDFIQDAEPYVPAVSKIPIIRRVAATNNFTATPEYEELKNRLENILVAWDSMPPDITKKYMSSGPTEITCPTCGGEGYVDYGSLGVVSNCPTIVTTYVEIDRVANWRPSLRAAHSDVLIQERVAAAGLAHLQMPESVEDVSVIVRRR
jgi:hypothetical protein